MEITVQIKSSDILTEYEIKEIVSDEIRNMVREQFSLTDSNSASNLAFYIKENILKEELEKHIESIKEKFTMQLDKFSFTSYDVTRNGRLEAMIAEQIELNEHKIKEHAQIIIDKRLKEEDWVDSYKVAEKIAETYKDIIIDAIDSTFKGLK